MSHNNKIEKIKTLKGQVSDAELRKIIGNSFAVKKTRRNEIFNQLFGKGKQHPACFKENGNKASIELKNVEDVTTVEDLIAYAKIDTQIWAVKKFSANVWDGKWQVKAEFEKKIEPKVISVFEELKAELLSYSPKVEKISTYTPGELLLEICLFDLHLGKLGHKDEVKTDYDIKIAREIFFNAIKDLVTSALKQGKIDKILFPIGNDFLNIDNDVKTTTAGTPQDVDSRFYKIFKQGREMLVDAINYLKGFAPVDVIVVRGNHDSIAMFHLGDALQCWFNNDTNVNIENSPRTRKYYSFGTNLIVFSHGDKEKVESFPLLAATEESEKWGQSKYREVHLGHRHQEQCREINGVKIRTIPSLSGNDAYHFEKGYTGNVRVGQGFVFEKNTGLATILYSRPVK